MLPQALLFKTRARNGDVFKADVLLDPEQVLPVKRNNPY